MDIRTLISIVVVLILFTVTYKFLPYRLLNSRKPSFAIFPKYRSEMSLKIDDKELEKRLAAQGFKPTNVKQSISYFTRGSILGDISIKLAKIRVGVERAANSSSILTVEASWVAAFDTGDLWQFTSELVEILEDD